jgi:hypothetical protein
MGYLLIFKQDDLGDTLSGKDGRTASCLRVSGILFRFVSFRFVSFGHTFTPKDFRWALDSELASAGVASFTCCFRIWLDSSTSFFMSICQHFFYQKKALLMWTYVYAFCWRLKWVDGSCLIGWFSNFVSLKID